MHQRSPTRVALLLALLTLSAALVASAGCTSALATAVWLIQGPNVPAEFNGLKGKRVAVVCRPLAALTYRDSSAAKDLAREMTKLLRQNIREADIVDYRKVAEWMDENVWEEYTEVGKAVDADFVVAVDLEHFGIFQGQTVYQGKASVTLKVIDCSSGDAVFERQPPQVVYPPNSARSTGDQQEVDFRREYIQVLADQLARHFYPHDPHANVALDSKYIH